MSLESAIADLVSASTQLTQSVNITKATVEAIRDSALAKEAPVTTAKDAVLASTAAATTDATTTGTKLAAVAADYAAQKTTKGLAAVQTSADSELKDRLHRRDPARHPFRGARPSLVMDFVRRECHRNNAAGNLEPVDLSTFMTFTRGSTATYVGPDGLIKTAGVNEARYGYDPVTGEALGLLVEEQRTNLAQRSNAVLPSFGIWWTTDASCIGNAALAPDGTLSASKFIASTVNTNHIINYGISGLTGTFTWSVYAKAAGYNYISLRELGTTGHGACFNLATGTIGETIGSCSPTITPVGNGWYRCTITVTLANQTFGCSVFSGTTNVYTETHAGDGISGAYLWGAQLEAGSFPTSYIPTPATFTGRASTKTYFDSNGVLQTAASGVAATDYGYVDGRWVSKGLSLEGQATNLLRASTPNTGAPAGAQTTAVWVGNSAVLGLNAVSVSGDNLVEIATPLGGNVSIAASVPYCFSLFSNKSTPLEMYINDQAKYRTSTVVPLGGSTFRHYVVGSVSTSLTTALHIRSANGHMVTGFQLEAGSYPTSYIPTTTAQVTRAADTSTSAQVTRAADSSTVSGSNFTSGWYTPDGWSLGVQFMSPYTHTQYTRGVFGFGSGVNLRGIGLRLYNDANGWSIFTARDSQTNINEARQASANVAQVRYTAGCGIASDGSVRYSLNNSALSKADIGFVRPTINTLYVGSQNVAGGFGYTNGYIRQLTYFPRQLSDADLQALTILED